MNKKTIYILFFMLFFSINAYAIDDEKKKDCIDYFSEYLVIPNECIDLNAPTFDKFKQIKNIKKIKTNMHTFKVMLEIYAVGNSGLYPINIEKLLKDASINDYYHYVKNPFDNKLPTWVDYDAYHNKDFPPACVIYKPVKKSNITSYQIFATDENAKILTDENGKEFYLSDN